MGKKRLEISYISDPRRRSSVFFNRRSGIFKKAHDLSKTCGTKVSVILTDLKGNLHVFSNRDDVKVHLKKSVLERAKNDTVQVFRYHDTDYPFNNLSHVGRESETFTEEDFDNITMLKEGSLLEKEEEGECLDLPPLLGKRKKLRVLTESLSKDLNNNPQKTSNRSKRHKESTIDLNIKKLKLNPRIREEKRAENRHFNQQKFEKKTKNSTKQNSINSFKSEDYHLTSLQNIIKQLRNKSSSRSKELAHRLPEVVKSLEDFYQFVGGELSTNCDAFTLDYCAWRYIVAVYFSDLNPDGELSEFVKKIPVDEFLKFVEMRPPPPEQRIAVNARSETTDWSLDNSDQSLAEMVHLAEDCPSHKRDYPSIFIASDEAKMDQLYSTEYLEFIILLKKHLEVFIQVILRKVEAGPNFKLREEVNKITIPMKSKMLKKHIFKKLAAIRSQWILNAAKTMSPSQLDKDIIERIQKATNTNACLEESIDPEILSKVFKEQFNNGLLNWITIQELLLTKLLGDLKLYAKTQQIFTNVSKSLGKKRTIEMMLASFEAQWAINDLGFPKETQRGKKASLKPPTSPNFDNSVIEEDNGSFFDWAAPPSHHIEELTTFKRFVPAQARLEDSNTMINLFDMNADNSSILSFEAPKNFFTA